MGAFVDAMNARARALGMSRTTFASPHGLDDRGVSSAADVLLLLAGGARARRLPASGREQVRGDPLGSGAAAADPEPQRDALALSGCLGGQDRNDGGGGVVPRRDRPPRGSGAGRHRPGRSRRGLLRRGRAPGPRVRGLPPADPRGGGGGPRERPGARRHRARRGGGEAPSPRPGAGERGSRAPLHRVAVGGLPPDQRFRGGEAAFSAWPARRSGGSPSSSPTCRPHVRRPGPGGVGPPAPSPAPSEDWCRRCSTDRTLRAVAARPDRPGSTNCR